jgi:HAD superfamily phosphoserine phosphatase-like hydrolase
MKKKKLAIFDIDGTIFRKNLHFELLDELVYMHILDESVRRDLVMAYGHWLNHEGTYEEYRDKLVSLYSLYIKGCKRTDIIDAAKIVARFHSKRTYIFSRDLIAKLSHDHIMLMISGSPLEIVKEYANIFKFDAYYGSVYEVDTEEAYTGKAVFEPTRDKGAVVEQYAIENGLTLEGSIGIGDTESDVSFLALVEQPIAFNPNINLKKIAEKEGWRIVVEKKDVIYEIK